MNQVKIARYFAKFFLRQSRGEALMQRFKDPLRDLLQGSVYILGIRETFGVTIPFKFVIVIVILDKILAYMAAWLDEVKWGFWKAENHYNAKELNPFNQELMARVQNVETLLETERKI